MRPPRTRKLTIGYLTHSMSVILGVVLIWRGLWYVLDGLDAWLFSGSHTLTAIGGIFLGLLILYLPDKDLKEIEKL